MLEEIVEKIYTEFANYRAKLPLDVCIECCMTIDETTKLVSLPLKEIPVELLALYNDSAKPNKTEISEVKYFLPRYIDLISQFKFPTHSPELSFSRLIPFDQTEWTKNELSLLKIFQTAFFKECINTFPIPSFGDKIDSILIMFWKSQIGIDNLFNIWKETDSLESTLHFKDLYYEGFEYYNRKKLTNVFGDSELYVKINNWIENKATKISFRTRIENIILNDNELDEQTKNEMSLLYETLITE
ncbi:hypothetical protein [Flavobacterium sp.]|uniref:hypothetical protein n=1 Tax=Flavobacterium sp. TaxID=239 RepID=UPI0037BE6CB0